MKRRTLLQTAVAAPFLAACATGASSSGEAPDPYPAPVPDPDSYAQPLVARVTHVAVDLNADFDRKVFAGTATLSIEAAAGAREIVLDCSGLTIQSVRTEHGPAAYTIGASRPDHGAPLTVAITPDVRTLTIAYETSPSAGALQWLTAQQTASGKPYLFSQGESILTRSWIPTQDSPGIRQSWEARIIVPAELKAVMSAEMLTPDGEAADGGKRAYRFRMQHPVPPYLIAIAIGDLAFRPTGPRTGVWSEPSVVDAAAREFSDMERMMRVAETLYGPYRWGRYDVLVLPPSFPFGGMENPRLTFATPTIIAGDKSLVNVITHELAHSWSGNLVTNAVWADSWMNEGFTTYIEGRISEALMAPIKWRWPTLWIGRRSKPRYGRCRRTRRACIKFRTTIRMAAARPSITTRARSSCAPSKASLGVRDWTHICVHISTATHSNRLLQIASWRISARTWCAAMRRWSNV